MIAHLPPPFVADTFYVTGGTLPAQATSYVTRNADAALYHALREGEFCYVLNARQMGKSSLMVRTARQLAEQGDAVVVLDLTAVGQNLTPEQWYDGLLVLLAEQLGSAPRLSDLEDLLDQFWSDNERLGPMQRFFAALQQVALPALGQRSLVMFVDEIDAVRSLPFSADEFFAGIRQCYVGRATSPELSRLRFCLLGTATPADLIQDTRLTPFNIGRRIELRDFTPEEAAPLAQGLGMKGQALLSRILYWTNGHPYLTQRLCRAVAEEGDRKGAPGSALTPRDVDRLCAGMFLSNTARETDDNLALVRNRLLKSEADVAAVLDLYRQVRTGRKAVADDETNSLTDVLKLSGVARSNNGRLQVRNRIYEHVFDEKWIEAHLPDAERRRQRAAYRRGLLRALGGAAGFVAVVGGIAAWGFVQAGWAGRSAAEARRSAVTARRAADRANRLLYIADMNLIPAQWKLGNTRGVLQLLEETRSSPQRGWEWDFWARRSQGERRTIQGQRGAAILAVDFSPDGRRLVTGSDDVKGQVKIWEEETGQLLHTLRGHTKSVTSTTFFSQGRRVLTASADGTARVWEASTGKELFVLRGHQGEVGDAAASPDGKHLATVGQDGTLRLWDAAMGQSIYVRKAAERAIVSVCFSPDGTRIATGNRDPSVGVWDTASGQKLRTFLKMNRYADEVCFFPDGKRLAVSDDNPSLRICDIETGEQTRLFRGGFAAIFSISFSPDGRHALTTGEDATARLWNVATGEEVLRLRGHTEAVTAARFSPDGRRVATASRDQTIKIWDVGGNGERRDLRQSSRRVFSAVFSPDGSRLLTGSRDATARVCDIETGKILFSLRPENAPPQAGLAAAYSPDGKKIATACYDGSLLLWDASTGKLLRTLSGPSDRIARTIAFSPDSTRIITPASDGLARIWDVKTGKEMLALRGHEGRLWFACFSPDGRKALTGGDDSTARVWDTATGKLLLTLRDHTWAVACGAFSADGARIATGGLDRSVKIWDEAKGKKMLALDGHAYPVTSVIFAPDGKRIATASEDSTARLWETETGKETLAFTEIGDRVWSVAFSPDGRRLVTACEDGNATLWSSEPIK